MPSVAYSEDLKRIAALPIRKVERARAEADARLLTPLLTTALGKSVGATLLAWQAYCLRELYENGGLYAGLPVGNGKAQPDSEPVLTPDGWRTMGSLRAGDFVIGSDGRPTQVSGVFPQGEREIWRATFSDGSFALCDAEHLWSFRTTHGDQTRTLRDWSLNYALKPRGRHLGEKKTVPLTRIESEGRSEHATCISVAAENQLYVTRHHLVTHNTLLSWLAAYVCDAERPMLIIPATLKDKTYEEFAAYSKHFVSPKPPPRIVTFEELTQDPKVDMLGKWGADMYIIDEAHKLSNQEASATKRIARDVDARMVKCCVMTGTGSRMSILDFSHFLIWALKDKAPVPLDVDECEAWASALDAKKSRKAPYGVGELLGLIDAEDVPGFGGSTRLRQARLTFQKRLTHTPGVVIVDDTDTPGKLTINLVPAPEDPVLTPHFDNLVNYQVNPDGLNVADTLDNYRTHLQLGCGGYSRITNKHEPAYPAWSVAKSAFSKFCVTQIKRTADSDYPLDTEGAVRKAYPQHELVQAWATVEKTFKPISEWVWLSASVVEWATAWAKQNTGIVFVQSVEVGRAIAQAAGLEYYGRNGKTDSGKSYLRADPKRSHVMSLQSNREGRNLQAWHKGAIIGWPQSGKYTEQLLGRLWRIGQKHDVTYDVLLTSGLTMYTFKMALAVESDFVKDTQSQVQKVMRAGINFPGYPSGALRWAEKKI